MKGIVESVPAYFPNIQLSMPDKKDIWYGFRPCTPDGLPYIGVSQKTKNLFIAGGHAIAEIGLGPATGRIIADLAGGRQPAVKIDAFNPGRF